MGSVIQTETGTYQNGNRTLSTGDVFGGYGAGGRNSNGENGRVVIWYPVETSLY